MKILYITNYDTMGGANHSLLNMMKILKDSYNVEPYLLVPGGGVIGKKSESLGIKVFKYDFRITYIDGNVKHPHLRRLTRRLMRYTDFYRILHKLRRSGERFDIIHSNSSVFDIGFFLSRKMSVPHVWHVREYGADVYNLYPSQSMRQVVSEYNRSYIIAISEAIRNKLENMGCNKNNISMIYNGVKIPASYIKEYLYGDIWNFCIVGGVQEGKNQLDVVKACKLLWEKGYSNFRLHIIGSGDSEYIKIIDELLNDDEFSKHIIMYGQKENVYELLRIMDVGIMASTFEAFGRVTVEYMANYIPVIATNSGANLELVDDSRNIYEVHDVEKLAAIMEEYIDDGRNVVEEGRSARKRAEGFSEEKNAKEVYELYNTIKVG